ncbi:uncharacterized protein TNCV_2749661 [Trichonephila clavipes]|nr:uncharacterized protein TNCV_2749661 [Trichonephila clavipes]
MESDSGRLLIWREQRTRYHQSNTVERHRTVTGLRYRDEILDPYVHPYAAAIGNDFILMDDNARPHRARIVEEYLEDHGLERMEWPARSPDLNPIEHLWDYLGREVAALNPPPRSLHELKQGLLCVWSSLPIPVSDNLINSMGNRCRQCIQSGNTAITKVQSNILMKMEGTLDSLQKLNTCGSMNIQTNHHVSSFQQSLVDLILCTDEISHPKDNAETRVTLKLLKHWKKLFEDHQVLCWTFSNDDERTIYNPVMNIWISGSHTQSFQKVFVHKSHTFSIEDECRKEIKSKEHFSILVSFRTFKFNYDYLKIHAVLSWYVGSETEFENELFLVLEEKTLIQQQMLFLTDLIISDVFDPKFKDISTLEDLACLKIWQQRVVFTFTSFRTNLQNIETFFPNISNFTLAPHLEKAYLKVFKDDYSFLFGVHIVFKTLNHSTVEAEAFVKNEDQLLLLEKHFYLHLPTDVLILPNGLTAVEITQLKQQAVCFMKDEIDLLLSMMNIYNVQGNFEKFNFQPETVVMSKENFLSAFRQNSSSKLETDESHLVCNQDCMVDGVSAPNQELHFGFALLSQSHPITERQILEA